MLMPIVLFVPTPSMLDKVDDKVDGKVGDKVGMGMGGEGRVPRIYVRWKRIREWVRVSAIWS